VIDKPETLIIMVIVPDKLRGILENIMGKYKAKPDTGLAATHTKLTPEQIRKIRRYGELGADARAVSDEFLIAPTTVRRIWRGETFRHVAKEPLRGMVEEVAVPTLSQEFLKFLETGERVETEEEKKYAAAQAALERFGHGGDGHE
jgi:hypothetical protein